MARNRCLASSTVIADHGIANSLPPNPRMPPNDSTAYATRPVITSIMSSSTRPMASPLRLTTRSWVNGEAPSVLRNLYISLHLHAGGHLHLQRLGTLDVRLG